MIDPLRYNSEKAPTYAIAKPVFCGACVTNANKDRRANPRMAVKYCTQCQKNWNLCLGCDEEAHRWGPTKLHVRRMMVVGPGVRKKLLVRGDAVNYPLTMDNVCIKVKSKTYLDGKLINREPTIHSRFTVGLSGKTVHVQVLGARNLIAADMGGTSDPFIVAMYGGKQLGITRVRPRTLNPKWDNETFIVPMQDNLPDPRNMARSQKGLFRLEVYDYDWFTQNDFLGHVEISSDKLQALAEQAGEEPVCVPLTLREFHGLVGIKLGLSEHHLCVRVCRAEGLDKTDPFGLSDPYAKVYFGDRCLGQTPVMSNTLDPLWPTGADFKVSINDIIRREREVLSVRREAVERRHAEDQAQQHQYVQQMISNNRQHTLALAGPPPPPALNSVNSAQMPENSVSSGPGSVLHMPQLASIRPGNISTTRTSYQGPGAFPRDDDDIVTSDAGEHDRDPDYQLFRIELYSHHSIRSHLHLGTSHISCEYLRKLLPHFPERFVAEPPVGLQEQLARDAKSGQALLSLASTLGAAVVKSVTKCMRRSRDRCSRSKRKKKSQDDDDTDQQHEEGERVPDEGASDSELQTLYRHAMRAPAADEGEYDPDPLYHNINAVLKKMADSRKRSPTGSPTAIGQMLSPQSYSPTSSRGLTADNLSLASRHTARQRDRDSKQRASELLLDDEAGESTSLLSHMSPHWTAMSHVSSPNSKGHRVRLFGDDQDQRDRVASASDGVSVSVSGASHLPWPPSALAAENAMAPPPAELPCRQQPDSESLLSVHSMRSNVSHDHMSSYQLAADGLQLVSVDSPEAAPVHVAPLDHLADPDPGAMHRRRSDLHVEVSYDNDYDDGTAWKELPAGGPVREVQDNDNNNNNNDDGNDDGNSNKDKHSDRDDQEDEDKEVLSKSSAVEEEEEEEQSVTSLQRERRRLMSVVQEAEREQEEDEDDNDDNEEDVRAESDKQLDHLDNSSMASKKSAVSNDNEEMTVGRMSRRAKRRAGKLCSSAWMRARTLLGQLLTRGREQGALLSSAVQEEFFTRTAAPEDPFHWSRIRHFQVDKESDKNVADAQETDRGFVVLRLIAASRGQVIMGLDEAVRHMSLGETALVKVRYDYAYGNYCMSAHIPPRANMVFTVELLEINNWGRLQMPRRVLLRLWRWLSRRVTVCLQDIARHREQKPWLKLLIRVLRFLRILPPLTEEQEEEEEEEQQTEQEEAVVAGDEESLDNESLEERIRIDPKMKRLLNDSVRAGSKYLWGFKPKPAVQRSSRQRKEDKKLAKLKLKNMQVIDEDKLLEDVEDLVDNDNNDDNQLQLQGGAGGRRSVDRSSNRQSVSVSQARSSASQAHDDKSSHSSDLNDNGNNDDDGDHDDHGDKISSPAKLKHPMTKPAAAPLPVKPVADESAGQGGGGGGGDRKNSQSSVSSLGAHSVVSAAVAAQNHQQSPNKKKEGRPAPPPSAEEQLLTATGAVEESKNDDNDMSEITKRSLNSNNNSIRTTGEGGGGGGGGSVKPAPPAAAPVRRNSNSVRRRNSNSSALRDLMGGSKKKKK